jgi:hypothetical protein
MVSYTKHGKEHVASTRSAYVCCREYCIYLYNFILVTGEVNENSNVTGEREKKRYNDKTNAYEKNCCSVCSVGVCKLRLVKRFIQSGPRRSLEISE